MPSPDRYKEDKGCLHCGIKNPVVLHFHHRDPSTKEVSIANGATISLEKVLKELEKCDVLCANCHLIEHAEQRKGKLP